MCIWVDDIIYFSTDKHFKHEFKEAIQKKFTVGDMSDLNWFLGMKVTCSPGVVQISQLQYVETMLTKFGMGDCKSVSTPIAEKLKLTREDCPEAGSEEQQQMRDFDFRGLIGSLNYLASTSRPDIAYVAHALSSYLENPGLTH